MGRSSKFSSFNVSWLTILFIQAISMCCCLAQNADTPQRIVGYYLPMEGSGLKLMDVDGSKLTHLMYAFANPYTDGTVTLEGPANLGIGDRLRMAVADQIDDDDKTCSCGGTCLKGQLNQLLKLRKKYPHLKTILSVGGWVFSTNFSQAVQPSNHQRFVKTATDLMIKYGFDGIDLDWEFPGVPREGTQNNPSDWMNFVLLMQEFKKYWAANVPKPEAKELSVCIPATRAASGKVLDDQSLVTMMNTVDFAMLMAYEYHHDAPRTWLGAPLYADSSDSYQESVLNINAGVLTYANTTSKNKILLGIPLYAMGYMRFASQSRPNEAPCFGANMRPNGVVATTQTYKTIIDWTSNKQFGFSAPVVDAKRVVATTCNGTHFYSFDIPQTFKTKSKYALDNGLGGVMLWNLAQDYASSDTNSGLASVSSAFTVNTKTILRPEDICILSNDEFCNWKCASNSRVVTGKVTDGDDKVQSPSNVNKNDAATVSMIASLFVVLFSAVSSMSLFI